jgi:recombination protein RecA
MFNEGISRVGEILDFAVATEIIKKSGSFFSYGDTKLGQGRDNVKAVLADNPDLCDELEAKVTEKVKELGLEVVLAKLAKG